MTFHIITLFKESFDSYINSSILGRAIRNKKINIKFYDPRDFVKPSKSQSKNEKPYLRIDNKSYGGGVGMVMEALPIIKAVEAALKKCIEGKVLSIKDKRKNHNTLIIWFSPSGKQFDNDIAENISKKYDNLILICGRYEGIDERVKKVVKKEFKNSKLNEISIGPYVLTGGELPAMITLDTISRRIPGVLGKIESIEENRIASSEVYTRPEVLEYKGKKYRVPKVLLTGNHAKIEEWRNKKRK